MDSDESAEGGYTRKERTTENKIDGAVPMRHTKCKTESR